MKIFCDDGSTAVKLAWYDNDKLNMSLSSNSFRSGWKVEGMGMRQTFNYELDGKKYTYDEVSNESIRTTHIEYQYTDLNVLAVHHGLQCRAGSQPQTFDGKPPVHFRDNDIPFLCGFGAVDNQDITVVQPDIAHVWQRGAHCPAGLDEAGRYGAGGKYDGGRSRRRA